MVARITTLIMLIVPLDADHYLFYYLFIIKKKLGNGLQKSSLSSEIENAQIEGPQVY